MYLDIKFFKENIRMVEIVFGGRFGSFSIFGYIWSCDGVGLSGFC